jgi:hypothetical protein
MEEYIKQHLGIGIALDKEKEHVHSCICIKSNKYVFVVVNYNKDTKEFDGFNVFRDKDIQAYYLWDEEDKAELKNNNFESFLNQVNLNKMNTFYSALKECSKTGLIAFYTNLNDNDYYEGKIVSLDRNSVTFQLIDEDSKWLENKIFKIKDISYFSFGTEYEKELMKLAT